MKKAVIDICWLFRYCLQQEFLFVHMAEETLPPRITCMQILLKYIDKFQQLLTFTSETDIII